MFFRGEFFFFFLIIFFRVKARGLTAHLTGLTLEGSLLHDGADIIHNQLSSLGMTDRSATMKKNEIRKN